MYSLSHLVYMYMRESLKLSNLIVCTSFITFANTLFSFNRHLCSLYTCTLSYVCVCVCVCECVSVCTPKLKAGILLVYIDYKCI